MGCSLKLQWEGLYIIVLNSFSKDLGSNRIEKAQCIVDLQHMLRICENLDQSFAVYMLNCEDSNIVHIAQTGRNIITRYKEYLRAFKHGKNTPNFFDHNYKFLELKKTEILHLATKG